MEYQSPCKSGLCNLYYVCVCRFCRGECLNYFATPGPQWLAYMKLVVSFTNSFITSGRCMLSEILGVLRQFYTPFAGMKALWIGFSEKYAACKIFHLLCYAVSTPDHAHGVGIRKWLANCGEIAKDLEGDSRGLINARILNGDVCKLRNHTASHVRISQVCTHVVQNRKYDVPSGFGAAFASFLVLGCVFNISEQFCFRLSLCSTGISVV